MKLTINDLDFSYSSTPILKNVKMELNPGEVVSILGPNGAGKSTLIKCIDRILNPRSGEIRLGDRDVESMSNMEIARHMGYVPQSAGRMFPTTVLDTVLMGRRPHVTWRFNDKDIDKALNALELMGIEDFALRDYGELSGGQQQRVIIARAIAQETDILLLDEPTSNLDIKHQIESMEIVKKMVKDTGISAIMAIHDLNLGARYSDRIIMMSEGNIVAMGSPFLVLTAENIASVYGVEAAVKEEEGIPYVVPLRSSGSQDM